MVPCRGDRDPLIMVPCRGDRGPHIMVPCRGDRDPLIMVPCRGDRYPLIMVPCRGDRDPFITHYIKKHLFSVICFASAMDIEVLLCGEEPPLEISRNANSV
jgi:hypothetical protein